MNDWIEEDDPRGDRLEYEEEESAAQPYCAFCSASPCYCEEI